MSTISSTGLGSGLDITSLVSQLVSAEKTPATERLDAREAKLSTELSAIGVFKGVLSDLQSSVLSLTLPSTFKSTTATSTNDQVFTASASYSTMTASYSIEVTQLAQAQRLELASTVNKDTQLGTGTLKISVGDGASHEIAINSANNTLEGIAEAINKTSGLGVTATILSDGDNRQLSLKSTSTGEDNTINIEVVDDDGAHTDATGLSQLAYNTSAHNLVQKQAGQDAKIKIDGSGIESASASNTFQFTSGSLSGVSLDVASVGTASLSIERDTTAAVEAVSAFVEAFNSMSSSVKSLTSYNSTTEEAGALLGDATVRTVNFQLRRMLTDSVGGASAFKNLSSIGIEVQRDGTLKFDSSKLENAIETDPTGVATLFTGAEASDSSTAIEGIGSRFKTYLDKILDSSNGTLSHRIETLNENLADVDDDRETLELRMEKLEARYLKQFNAMDSLVAELTSIGTYLTQQFEAMSSSSD